MNGESHQAVELRIGRSHRTASPPEPMRAHRLNPPARKVQPMTGSSRRNFLIASGAGAAAVGVAAAMPGMASAQTPTAEALTTPSDAQPLAAHISDPKTGIVSIFVGGHEVVVHDHDLVARITHAAQAKSDKKAV